jgi:hypothetical protein
VTRSPTSTASTYETHHHIYDEPSSQRQHLGRAGGGRTQAAGRLNPGGGGVNVARVIQRLGGEALAVYALGGPTGEL